MKDLFGGELDEDKQRQNGHFWVGIGTSQEHCMTCRLGPITTEPCAGNANCSTCKHHLDEHQGFDRNCTSPYPSGNVTLIPEDQMKAEDVAKMRRGSDNSFRPRCECKKFERTK